MTQDTAWETVQGVKKIIFKYQHLGTEGAKLDRKELIYNLEQVTEAFKIVTTNASKQNLKIGDYESIETYKHYLEVYKKLLSDTI